MTSNMIRLLSVTLPLSLVACPALAEDPVQRSFDGVTAVTTASGLKYYDIKVGDGDIPSPGSMVKVHYSGWLKNGTLFDSSVKKGQPFTFNTSGGVIKGWIEGISTMRVGGVRRLEIPSALAYGSRGAGSVIPQNSDLVFEIEFLSIEKKGESSAVKAAAPKSAPTGASSDPKQRSIKGVSAVTTASGLKYYDIKVGTGEEPKSGAKVNVHYSGWSTEGKLFDSSVKRGQPFSFNTDRGVIKGWIEGVKGMKVGGIRRLEIPAALAYGKGDLIFEVELLSIEKKAEGAADAAPKKEEKPELPDPKQSSIEGLEAVTTKSGMKYYVLKKGDGETPRSGATVNAHYSGWLTDGTLFDSSVKRDKPFSFRTNGGVIDGWLEAVSTMKVGEKRRLEIPPELGYGERQSGKIPPNSTLIFEMELLSIDKNGPERSSIEGLKEVKKESGLKYWVIKEGAGDPPGPTGRVRMHVSAWLASDGRLAGTTRERGEPMSGAVSSLLKGWGEAAAEMKTGEIRCLAIPSDMAYGEQGTRGVPPNSDLIFEVEMVEVLPEIKQTSTNGITEVTLESGTKYWDIKVGEGDEVKSDSNCVAHYTGWLLDGSMFDSSTERDKPHNFSMARGVIQGWQEGLIGMKVGGKRRLQIPPEKAYGSRPRGRAIPANSTLIFEIDLLEIKTP